MMCSIAQLFVAIRGTQIIGMNVADKNSRGTKKKGKKIEEIVQKCVHVLIHIQSLRLLLIFFRSVQINQFQFNLRMERIRIHQCGRMCAIIVLMYCRTCAGTCCPSSFRWFFFSLLHLRNSDVMTPLYGMNS